MVEADSIKALIVIAALVGLFFFSLVSFATNLQNNNGANFTITDNEALNNSFSNIQDELSSLEDTARTQKNNTEKGEVIIGTDSFLILAFVGAARIFSSSIIGIYDITLGLASETLGISPVTLGTIASLILVAIIFAIARFIRRGE